MARKRLTARIFLPHGVPCGQLLLKMAVQSSFFSSVRHLGISAIRAYEIYFYSHWVISFIEYALLLLVIYSVFRQSDEAAGRVAPRGQDYLSVGCGRFLCPFRRSCAGAAHRRFAYTMATFSSQIQQGISVLILCLLLFVCFFDPLPWPHLQEPHLWCDAGARSVCDGEPDRVGLDRSGRTNRLFSCVCLQRAGQLRSSDDMGNLLRDAAARAQDDSAADDFALLPLEPHLGSAWAMSRVLWPSPGSSRTCWLLPS